MEVQSAFAGAASAAAAAALGMGDAFHIDDLLDFSNEDIAGPIGEGFPLSNLDSTVTTAAAENVSGTSLGAPLTGSKHLLDAGPDDHPADVLCVPCDDLAELEWLSKFVEDSFSMGETPTRVCNDLSVSCEDMQFESSYNSCKDRFQSASPVSVLESSASSGSTRAGNCADNNAQTNHHQHSNLLYRELSVPGRARSKRARTGGRVWGNSRILSAAAAASSTSTTDTESLSSDSNVISGGGGGIGGAGHSSSALSADCSHEDQEDQQQHSILLMMTPPPKAVTTVKKPWKPNGKSGSSSSTGGAKKGGQLDGGVGAGGAAAAASQSWRCLHCATQRTPQWRAGPMGPKTLCNACGVRYKSGRLLPEYRPAGSPGYVGHKHSNSHKKILEMRRQRENGSAPVEEHNNNNNNELSHLSQSPCSSSLLEEDPAGICTSQN